MTAAGHPRCRAFDERQRRPEIQSTPPPAPVAEVITGAASPAHTAALTLAPDGPDRHDDLSLIANLHVLHHIAPVIGGDLGGVYAALDAAATQQQEAMEKMVLTSMSAITDLTGNKLDAAGQPWSWDHITDAVSRLPPGDDGEMDITLVLHPDDLARLQSLPPPTPAQIARREAMLERKREDWKAQKRERRLR